MCHVIADELQWEISQVDPRKTLEVGLRGCKKLYFIISVSELDRFDFLFMTVHFILL